MTIKGNRNIVGAGGLGGGKGGESGGGGLTENPNTLLSKSTARVIDVISEGEIKGLVDGNKSIILDETPLQNADGSYNFQGVTVSTRNGTPTQSHVPGFPAVESEVSVGTKVTTVTPVTRTITNANVNAVRVKIRVPAMTDYNTETNEISGTTVQLAIDLMPDGGAFSQVKTVTITGKCTSPYERVVRIDVPAGSDPWTIRVRRLTADSSNSELQNETYWSSYTEVIDAKLTYPDTALVGFQIDAEAFGNRIPARTYHIDGLITQVPSNYDPVARTYSGIWDGTFKLEHHSNPAWVLWDLMTNDRYGLGEDIDADLADKATLYSIGQYCDEMVPDGYGGMEPRFSFNGAITSRAEAVRVLDAIASTFRGMIYWGAGLITMAQDAPKTATKLVSPANVIDGEFSYTGSALKARHSVVVVSWNDPNDLSRRTFEVVRRDDLIAKYGYREKEIAAYGCTSRGQAHRLGQWILETEENETETVTYRAALDHADLRPGDVIHVADPSYAGARFGGRTVSATTTTLEIDAPVDIVTDQTYQLSVVLPDGSIETRDLTNAVATDVTSLTWTTALSQTPQADAMWIVSASNAKPRPFRVIANREKGKNIYEITALFYDENKYALVDTGVDLDDDSFSIYPTGPLKAPTALSLREFFTFNSNVAQSAATLSWTQPDDPRISTYEVEIQNVRTNAYVPLGETSTNSLDDTPTFAGEYSFRVRSKAPFLTSSNWVEFTQVILGPNQPIGDVDNFEIDVQGQNAVLTWDKLAAANLDHYEIRFNSQLQNVTWDTASVLVGGVGKDANSAVVPARVGTYLIKAVSVSGLQSTNAAVITSEIAGAENINNVLCISEETAWAGTHDDTRTSGGELTLDDTSAFLSTWATMAAIDPIGGDYVTDGIYYFANSINIGGVFRFQLSLDLDAYLINAANVMASWATLASVNPLSSVGAGQWSALVEYRQTQDDPTAPLPTWSDWKPFRTGFYSAWGIEFRLVLHTENVGITPAVRSVKICADMEDRIAGAENVACPVPGLRVTYASAFNNIPTVHIDGQSLNTGDYHRVTNKDQTGFDVQFFDASNTPKAASFDWIAKGYGYKK